eukprot:3031603-Heterocapsa_arctica.AAC.1
MYWMVCVILVEAGRWPGRKTNLLLTSSSPSRLRPCHPLAPFIALNRWGPPEPLVPGGLDPPFEVGGCHR